MKTREILDKLKNIIDDKEKLELFVKSYFMTYNYDIKQWQMSEFDALISHIRELDSKSNIGDSRVFRDEINSIVSKLVDQKKQVEAQYYNQNGGLFGMLKKTSDWLFPTSKLPDDVSEMKELLSSSVKMSATVADGVSASMKKVADDARSKSLATTHIPGTKTVSKVDMGELANVLKNKGAAGTNKANTKQ